MKKIYGIIIIIVSIFVLTSCKKTPTTIDKDMVVKTDFISYSNEYKVNNSKVDLYYFKENNNPFIDIKDYIDMLSGLYYSEEFEYVEDILNHTLTLKLELEYSDGSIYNFDLVIDHDLDTIYVESLDFFDVYINSPETNYSEGLIDLDPVIVKGNDVTFDIGEYGFDIIKKDKVTLIPLHIVNLLFNQSVYFDAYFNGDKIYGIDTADMDDKDIKKIIKSSKNSESMPESVAKANNNYMEFVLDYFYGLRVDREITSGKDFLAKYKDDLLNPKQSANQIFNITEQLDDLHTSHMTRGVYDNRRLDTSYSSKYEGPNIKAFYDGVRSAQDEAVKYFGITSGFQPEIKFKDYEIIHTGKTAIIYLLEFDAYDTYDFVEDIIKSLPNTVENVVIDLTFNTGGNLGAVLRVFTLMTNKTISYHYQNPLDGTKVSANVKGEKPAYSNFDYYIKTSSITFSAANLMASMALELEIPVIGKKSSGGASSISFYVTPDGSIILLSSNTILSRLKDGQYLSIENGIEPQVKLRSLYNHLEIEQAINQFKVN